MSTFGWETLAPHHSRRQLRSRDGGQTVAAKVRTGGSTAHYLYLDLHDADAGWTILVLDTDRQEVARGTGALKREAWAACERILKDKGLLR